MQTKYEDDLDGRLLHYWYPGAGAINGLDNRSDSPLESLYDAAERVAHLQQHNAGVERAV